MIHNAYKLMKSLRSIVNDDDDEIWIDYEHKMFQKVREANQPERSSPFPSNEPSVQGLLKNLRDEGYITLDNLGEYCSLTYKALYYEQIVRHDRIQYLLRSIFVPIILSIITSILTTTFLPELLSTLLQKIL